MAKHPHHDDESKPNGKQPPTPKPVIPNMSLEGPEEEEILEVEEILEAEEVLDDDDVPTVEPVEASDVAADVLGEADAPVVEPEPVIEEAVAEEVVEATDSSVTPEAPVEAFAEPEPVAAAPTSDVDLNELFDASPTEPIAPPEPEPEPSFAALAEASAPIEAPAADVQPEDALFDAAESSEPAATTASDVIASADDITEAPAAADSPATPDFVAAEEPVEETPPSSGIFAAEEPVEEAAPASGTFAAEEAVEETPPSSGIFAAEEPVEEAAPGSGTLAAEEAVEEATPSSGIFAAEEAVEEAAPASGTLAAEEVVEEAAPASEVFEAEEAVEEASPASDVFAAEEVVEDAMPASEAKSAEIAEEVAEAEEVSSATRKAEAVLEDEGAVAEAASAAEEVEEAIVEEEVLDAEEAAEVTGSSGVLSDVVAAGSSAVKKLTSSVGKTAQFDQTVAFDAPPASASKRSDDDLLVTEEETAGAAEASAVDLGEMPARKGSSARGIDKVAEALESGVDLDAEEAAEVDESSQLAATVPSVEFDELLDEMGDSDEKEIPSAKKKKPSTKHLDEDATEMDTDDEVPVSKAKSKKAKSAPKFTGDDIDLDEVFGDAEAEEAVEAEEAEEAEAVEAFDDEEAEAAEAFDAEEAEAAEAFDAEEGEAAEVSEEEAASFFQDDDEPTPKKKVKAGKKKSKLFVDEEAAEVEAEEEDLGWKKKKGKKKTAMFADEEPFDRDEDEDEDLGWKKKKNKKSKKPVPPAPVRRPSTLLRVFAGMFLAFLMIGGGGAAAWFFVPDEVINVAKESPNYTAPAQPKPEGPKVAEKTKADKARELLVQGKFDEVINDLKDAKEADELAVRGEAKWHAYLKRGGGGPVGPESSGGVNIDEVVKELTDGKNEPLAKLIKEHVDANNLKLAGVKAIEDQLNLARAAKENVDKTLASITGALQDGKLVADKDKIDVAAVKKSLDELNADKKSLADVNKVLDDMKYKPGKDGIIDVLAKKKDADDAVAAVNKVLADDAKIKDEGAKGVLKVVKDRDGFKKDRDDYFKIMKDAFQELIESKNVPDDGDPLKQLVEGVQKVRKKAESPLSIPLAQLGMSLGTLGTGSGKMVEKTFDMAKVMTELNYFKGREPFIQTPEQKLESHVALLQDRRRKNPQELNAIRLETEWVRSKASKADDDARAKALYVQGLIQRNLEKYAEARTTFEETLKLIPPIDKAGTWNVLARKSHKELVDPNEYYLPRMARFQADGDLNAALAEADLSLKAIPDNARLHAERALIRFEMIRGKKDKTPAQAQKDIRTDAAAAAKDDKLAAEASYIVGLLEEEIGNAVEAEKHFRQALKLHPAADDASSKYRVALGRILLRERTEGAAPVAPPPPPPPADEKKKDDKGGAMLPSPSGRGAGGEGERTLVIHPWTPMIVEAVIAQQPFDELEDKETLARLNETLKLAEELIASKNEKIKGQGYLLKGSALSKLGRRTEGLKEYTKGLKMVFPGIETKEMEQLVADHPAFQRPDVSATPNPVMAERHFGEGMHAFWSKQYVEAETQFAQATKYFDRDARYFYYLGLAQLHQKTKKKKDFAIDSFEQGARLEAKAASTNPDTVREINASLERIQGELRQYLNGFRYNAKLTEPETKDAKDGK